MSDRIGPASDAEATPERHPYASHPATLVLEAHELSYWSRHGTLAHCTCGTTSGSHAAHLTEVLHQAGLLPDGPPTETPTTRVLAERAAPPIPPPLKPGEEPREGIDY